MRTTPHRIPVGCKGIRLQINDRRIDFNARRTVTPRKTKFEPLSIIAVDLTDELVWTESDDAISPLSQLPAIVLQEPNSILAGYEIGISVKQIADDFKGVETFQIKCSPIERELSPWMHRLPDGHTELKPPKRVEHGVSFAFLGWRETKNKRSKWFRKHFPVDPLLFTSSFKPEYKTADRSLDAVIVWTMAVREFLQDNNLAFRATQTGIAAQLLRDKRFYPAPRRKVPTATNGALRDQLPGNYYLHNAHKNLTYSALEVDQKSSHHSCAADLTFPNANSLYAKGYFKTLPDKPFAYEGTPFYKKLLAQHGLFYVKLTVPRGSRTIPFLQPNAEYDSVNGSRCAWVYSNEIADLLETGCRINYIIAAWTSTEVDTGLNDFAKWSLKQLADADPWRKRWLKPMLLSAYGLLATRPRPMKSGYLRGIGEVTNYHVGRGEVMQFYKYESDRPFEPGFVNVIHRGMIEAETRLRSLRMARFLHNAGFTVLTVYADAVYVCGERAVPFLPEGWGTKEISNAYFPNSNQVVCDQFVKLPGHAGRRRTTLIDEIRGRINEPVKQ